MRHHGSFGIKNKNRAGPRTGSGVRAGTGETALGCASPYFCWSWRSTSGDPRERIPMTETISPADTQPAESPHLARPHTDAAALRVIDEATKHLRDRALKIRACPELHKPASKDMPGRQRHIQDCVDQILAKVDQVPAAD
jgi:hypothetical protein